MPVVVRTTTPMNVLAEWILGRLRNISHRKDAAYVTTPLSVKRLSTMGDFAGMQKPSLALSSMAWEVEPQCARRFEGTLTFGIHCISENTADPEGELMDLVSDVIYALTQDVQMGAQAIYLFPTRFEPNADLSQRTGFAVTTVSFECRYRFNFDAP